MSRPLRIEFPGALYHVTARGNAGTPIYLDDADHARFLALLGREIEQQRWLCHAYCLMGNHYHLLIETPEANLVRGMTRFGAVYPQWFNRRHGRAGHLFQGRYKAIVVERESHLLELARYIVLNPVRAGLAPDAAGWRWSSYRATAGREAAAPWLTTWWILDQFGARRAEARIAYRRFVAEGSDEPSPWCGLRGQMFLGGDDFLRDMADKARRQSLAHVPSAVARPDRPTARQVIAEVAAIAGLRGDGLRDLRSSPEAFRAAVFLLRRASNLTLGEVATLAGVSPGRVSQIQRAIEDAGGLGQAFGWAGELDRHYKV